MTGTTLAVGVVAAFAAATMGLATVGSAAVFVERLHGGADAAALAAADTISGVVSGAPCDVAARVAATVAADVVSCDVEGPIATIRIEGSFGPFRTSAIARAGPPVGPSVVVRG